VGNSGAARTAEPKLIIRLCSSNAQDQEHGIAFKLSNKVSIFYCTSNFVRSTVWINPRIHFARFQPCVSFFSAAYCHYNLLYSENEIRSFYLMFAVGSSICLTEFATIVVVAKGLKVTNGNHFCCRKICFNEFIRWNKFKNR